VGPFNMGNPGEFTMLELAEVCLPSKLPIVCNKVLFGSQKNAFRCGFFFFFFFFMKYSSILSLLGSVT
jgi:hypothetical protein